MKANAQSQKKASQNTNYERDKRLKKVGHAPHHIKHKKALYNFNDED